MTCPTLSGMQAALCYIETHLEQKLTLEAVAANVHYSPYHLHRSFAACTGQTLHNYAARRQLTEAARLLVSSDAPILDIALRCGYTSQQAFSAAFKTMYKLPPAQYRRQKVYYPLQLPLTLSHHRCRSFCAEDIRIAEISDIPAWLTLVRSVVDGYPYLKEADYLQALTAFIHKKQALILTDDTQAIGAMLYAPTTGSIDFFGVHPQYRRSGIAKLFLDKLLAEDQPAQLISTTTFRAHDRADTGYRSQWQKLGFAPEALLVEYGYPTQRFILSGRSK